MNSFPGSVQLNPRAFQAFCFWSALVYMQAVITLKHLEFDTTLYITLFSLLFKLGLGNYLGLRARKADLMSCP